MVKIKFTAQGSNTLIGGFGTGDIATVGEAIGKHLVEEARVARYVESGEPRKPAPVPRKPRAVAKVSPADMAAEPENK